MAHPLQGIRDGVDGAGMPVGRCGNPGIGAPAVLVDPGDHPMITILETDVNGVDMGGRGQGAIQQIAALFGTEIAGIGGGQLGDKAQRAFGVVDQILGAFNAGLAGLCDRFVQDRYNAG